MANLTDIITQELPTKADREEFVRMARLIRDSYSHDSHLVENEATDLFRAAQHLTWHRIVLAAELLVSSAPK
ncbi:MAG: hypothetical protein E6R03_00770 [Hyphomicrobiaceae bacterium]|nr:MAG: hypothetical protein E6R03_00770 [Hyphomicrobiaceae bacterium]